MENTCDRNNCNEKQLTEDSIFLNRKHTKLYNVLSEETHINGKNQWKQKKKLKFEGFVLLRWDVERIWGKACGNIQWYKKHLVPHSGVEYTSIYIYILLYSACMYAWNIIYPIVVSCWTHITLRKCNKGQYQSWRTL